MSRAKVIWHETWCGFRCANATQLRFEDGAFDVAPVTTVLHMMRWPTPALSQ